MDNYFISENTKKEIIINLIEPNYKEEIKSNIRLKKTFKNYGLVFETMSKFFVGISSIISFATGIYKYQVLAFLAGTTSVISLVLLQYSSYAYRESKKIGNETNFLLKKLLLPENNDNLSIPDSNPPTNIDSNPTSNIDSLGEINLPEPFSPKRK